MSHGLTSWTALGVGAALILGFQLGFLPGAIILVSLVLFVLAVWLAL